jgi:hypothetical protein
MARVQRTVATLALAILALAALGGCSGVRENLGLVRKPPDEFTVVRKPPLVIPPNFSLRPPRTGTEAAEEVDVARRARSALIGDTARQPAAAVRPAGGSTGEQALLTRARAAGVDPTIRDVINRETLLVEERDRSFVDRLIFWRRDNVVGDIVDARKEAERLRRTSATGEAPTAGEIPVIKRRRRALLEGIF